MSAAFRRTLAIPAAAAIAPPKHAEYPAAKSCSGFVPGPFEPGGEICRLIFPSGLVLRPSRPAVVLATSDASTVAFDVVAVAMWFFLFFQCDSELGWCM